MRVCIGVRPRSAQQPDARVLPFRTVNLMLPTLLARLRRVTTSGNYIPEIDGLRFVAIFGVVAYHTAGYWTERAGRTYPPFTGLESWLAPIIGLGFYGVHLFFLISGFVLAMPFCKRAFAGGRPVDLKAYFLRRLTRLEPPYVITMVAFFALMPLFNKGTWGELFPHLVASLLYVHNAVYGCGSLINNNAWSLEVEVQFYLLMPLVAALFWLPTTLRRGMFVMCIAFFSLHRLWLPETFPVSILQYAQFFLAGILLCDFWTTDWRHRRRTWKADLPVVLAAPVFYGVNVCFFRGLATDVLNPWLMFAAAASALTGTVWARGLTWGWIPVIGGMCYSIYLLHARVLAAVIHGGLATLPLFGAFFVDYAIVLAVCSVAIVVVSGIFYWLVEKPCMNPDWPSLLWNRLRPGAGRHAVSGEPVR